MAPIVRGKNIQALVRTTGDPVKAVTIAAWGNGSA
tara:strand:- start:1054 stop:1158 length:105 start_codon:yes stop_codon:yes gene_type:complete